MFASPNLPDRLGHPGFDIRDDPGTDPRMIAAMTAIGLDVAPPSMPVTAANTIDELLAYCVEAEAGFDALRGCRGRQHAAGLRSHVLY